MIGHAPNLRTIEINIYGNTTSEQCNINQKGKLRGEASLQSRNEMQQSAILSSSSTQQFFEKSIDIPLYSNVFDTSPLWQYVRNFFRCFDKFIREQK